MTDPDLELRADLTRRALLRDATLGLGGLALGGLLGREASAQEALPALPHFAPKARRVIYLFQNGAPSHVDLFDWKPILRQRHGEPIPDSVAGGKRFSTMLDGQTSRAMLGELPDFARHGESGATVSSFLPRTAAIADRLCFVKSMHTTQVNHAPAITYFMTGAEQAGRPTMGAWLSYGLGRMSDDVPAFVAMTSRDKEASCGQIFYDFYWGSGFLPTVHQGVKFRGTGDPVLYLKDPAGIDRGLRRRMLDDLAALNEKRAQEVGDPEIRTRIAQYEMAFAMQASVPDLMDTKGESAQTLALYGCQPGDGSFASNCLLARRLAERGVRFIQMYHKDWDHHGGVKEGVRLKAEEIDRACMALITDLKDRGMLDETLLVWAGEFGRTPMSQGTGRDHHNKAMTVWMAGGGIKGGMVYGATDELGYAAVDKVCTVHDMHATMLHCLGIDHAGFSVKFQGLDAKLTGVEGASVLTDILA